ncbi:MAG: HlyD family efflux transporter periplasmic adaptor subunit [Thermoanaerobaculum sp.]|nr:HlyD family efflux transporter periplasmic adaptor subunit [Thermoanaerobaculum sp.]MDW7966525.1 HlyD family efflux transporter periplasmic adaptor subunit [Thermoanaerobaculum sp.]
MKGRALFVAVTWTLMACKDQKGPRVIHASGHIEVTQVKISTQVEGILAEAPWQEWQPVEAGQLIARVANTYLEQELARARAERDAARASLALLHAGSRPEKIAEAKARLAAAEAELAGAEKDLARYGPLAERGTAARKLADDAAHRVELLHQQVNALKARLALVIEGPRPEDLGLARARLAAAEASVRLAEQRLADARLVAPCSGVLTARLAEPGEWLPRGAPVAVLADLDHPWLEIFLDEPVVSGIRLGQEVQVRVDGQPGFFTGRVSYIAQQAEFTPQNVQTPDERAKLVFRVKVSLPQQDGLFKPGMPADAYLALGE